MYAFCVQIKFLNNKTILIFVFTVDVLAKDVLFFRYNRLVDVGN